MRSKITARLSKYDCQIAGKSKKTKNPTVKAIQASQQLQQVSKN
jgi:hypothetical protein